MDPIHRSPSAMAQQKFRRRRKLIKPGLQLRLSARFLGLGILMMGLQFTLLQALLQEAAGNLPSDQSLLLDEAPALGLRLLGWSALVFLPLTLLVGIVGSFRFAGPLYRFEMFLKSLIAGERPDDIRLRSKDELKDLAELLNEATGALRRPQSSTAPSPLRRDEQHERAA